MSALTLLPRLPFSSPANRGIGPFSGPKLARGVNPCRCLLLLVTILSQSFFAFVCGHFVTFPFLSAWHNLLLLSLCLRSVFNTIRCQAIKILYCFFYYLPFGTANIVIFFDLLNKSVKNTNVDSRFSLILTIILTKIEVFMNTNGWKPVSWIFFDLDDTLWNFTANSARSLKKLYDISPILRKLFKSVDEFVEIYHTHNAIMWQQYSRGLVTSAQLKTERWRRTLATRQFEVLTAVCEELDSNYLEILAEGAEMIPGVVEMLERLTKKYLIAVLSNGFLKTQYRKLHFSGLEKYVTRTIVSDEIGINKPDKRIFDYAVAETGAQPPLLMVGDNAESDIFGAMNAGWYAIWYNPQGKEFPFTSAFLQEKGIDPDLLYANVRDMDSLEKAITAFFADSH